jgi:hypothetical protein
LIDVKPLAQNGFNAGDILEIICGRGKPSEHRSTPDTIGTLSEMAGFRGRQLEKLPPTLPAQCRFDSS